MSYECVDVFLRCRKWSLGRSEILTRKRLSLGFACLSLGSQIQPNRLLELLNWTKSTTLAAFCQPTTIVNHKPVFYSRCYRCTAQLFASIFTGRALFSKSFRNLSKQPKCSNFPTSKQARAFDSHKKALSLSLFHTESTRIKQKKSIHKMDGKSLKHHHRPFLSSLLKSCDTYRQLAHLINLLNQFQCTNSKILPFQKRKLNT